MAKAGDFHDVIRKKINSLPIDLVSDEYLYDHELSNSKENENLSKVVFNDIPEDYLRNHEINIQPLETTQILNLEYGELDVGFLADNSLDEEQSKVWDVVSKEDTVEKIIVNGKNIKGEPKGFK